MKESVRALRRRMVCILLSISVFFSFLTAPPQGMAAPQTPENFASKTILENVTDFRLPENLGKVEDRYDGRESRIVAIIQDAHAIPDAQRNIQKLITHIDREYGAGIVGLEGASARLDPQIFKSFPEQDLLQETLDAYFELGELAGGTAAAIVSEHPEKFHGVEDWTIYEEGVGLYLSAMKQEASLTAKLESWLIDLSKRKETVYSKELLALDRALAKFWENEADLLSTLKLLAKIKAPGKGSEIELMLEESQRKQASLEGVDLEVKVMAEKVKKYYEKLPAASMSFPRRRESSAGSPTKAFGDDSGSESVRNDGGILEFNQQYQQFLTGQIPPQAFALFMKDNVRKVTQGKIPAELKMKMSAGLAGLLGKQKRMKDIEGTKFFEDLKLYADKVRSALSLTKEQRALNLETDEFRLTKKMIKLEVSRAELEEYKSKAKSEKLKVTDDDLKLHLAFYENAEKRDEVLMANLLQLAPNDGRSTSGYRLSIMVAGGFHARGLAADLKEKGISYVLILPQIAAIPKKTNYRDQMKGDVSWKDYFEVENGKVSIYKAFVRGTRDRLLAENGRLAKRWRDQIIRDMADKKNIERAGDYTQFIDEVSNKDKREELRAKIERVEKFLDGVKRLNADGKLSEQNILQLLRPATIGAPKTSPGVLTREAFIPTENNLVLAASEQRVQVEFVDDNPTILARRAVISAPALVNELDKIQAEIKSENPNFDYITAQLAKLFSQIKQAGAEYDPFRSRIQKLQSDARKLAAARSEVRLNTPSINFTKLSDVRKAIQNAKLSIERAQMTVYKGRLQTMRGITLSEAAKHLGAMVDIINAVESGTIPDINRDSFQADEIYDEAGKIITQLLERDQFQSPAYGVGPTSFIYQKASELMLDEAGPEYLRRVKRDRSAAAAKLAIFLFDFVSKHKPAKDDDPYNYYNRASDYSKAIQKAYQTRDAAVAVLSKIESNLTFAEAANGVPIPDIKLAALLDGVLSVYDALEGNRVEGVDPSEVQNLKQRAESLLIALMYKGGWNDRPDESARFLFNLAAILVLQPNAVSGQLRGLQTGQSEAMMNAAKRLFERAHELAPDSEAGAYAEKIDGYIAQKKAGEAFLKKKDDKTDKLIDRFLNGNLREMITQSPSAYRNIKSRLEMNYLESSLGTKELYNRSLYQKVLERYPLLIGGDSADMSQKKWSEYEKRARENIASFISGSGYIGMSDLLSNNDKKGKAEEEMAFLLADILILRYIAAPEFFMRGDKRVNLSHLLLYIALMPEIMEFLEGPNMNSGFQFDHRFMTHAQKGKPAFIVGVLAHELEHVMQEVKGIPMELELNPDLAALALLQDIAPENVDEFGEILTYARDLDAAENGLDEVHAAARAQLKIFIEKWQASGQSASDIPWKSLLSYSINHFTGDMKMRKLIAWADAAGNSFIKKSGWSDLNAELTPRQAEQIAQWLSEGLLNQGVTRRSDLALPATMSDQEKNAILELWRKFAPVNFPQERLADDAPLVFSKAQLLQFGKIVSKEMKLAEILAPNLSPKNLQALIGWMSELGQKQVDGQLLDNFRLFIPQELDIFDELITAIVRRSFPKKSGMNRVSRVSNEKFQEFQSEMGKVFPQVRNPELARSEVRGASARSDARIEVPRRTFLKAMSAAFSAAVTGDAGAVNLLSTAIPSAETEITKQLADVGGIYTLIRGDDGEDFIGEVSLEDRLASQLLQVLKLESKGGAAALRRTAQEKAQRAAAALRKIAQEEAQRRIREGGIQPDQISQVIESVRIEFNDLADEAVSAGIQEVLGGNQQVPLGEKWKRLSDETPVARAERHRREEERREALVQKAQGRRLVETSQKRIREYRRLIDQIERDVEQTRILIKQLNVEKDYKIDDIGGGLPIILDAIQSAQESLDKKQKELQALQEEITRLTTFIANMQARSEARANFWSGVIEKIQSLISLSVSFQSSQTKLRLSKISEIINSIFKSGLLSAEEAKKRGVALFRGGDEKSGKEDEVGSKPVLAVFAELEGASALQPVQSEDYKSYVHSIVEELVNGDRHARSPALILGERDLPDAWQDMLAVGEEEANARLRSGVMILMKSSDPIEKFRDRTDRVDWNQPWVLGFEVFEAEIIDAVFVPNEFYHAVRSRAPSQFRNKIISVNTNIKVADSGLINSITMPGLVMPNWYDAISSYLLQTVKPNSKITLMVHGVRLPTQKEVSSSASIARSDARMQRYFTREPVWYKNITKTRRAVQQALDDLDQNKYDSLQAAYGDIQTELLQRYQGEWNPYGISQQAEMADARQNAAAEYLIPKAYAYFTDPGVKRYLQGEMRVFQKIAYEVVIWNMLRLFFSNVPSKIFKRPTSSPEEIAREVEGLLMNRVKALMKPEVVAAADAEIRDSNALTASLSVKMREIWYGPYLSKQYGYYTDLFEHGAELAPQEYPALSNIGVTSAVWWRPDPSRNDRTFVLSIKSPENRQSSWLGGAIEISSSTGEAKWFSQPDTPWDPGKDIRNFTNGSEMSQEILWFLDEQINSMNELGITDPLLESMRDKFERVARSDAREQEEVVFENESLAQADQLEWNIQALEVALEEIGNAVPKITSASSLNFVGSNAEFELKESIKAAVYKKLQGQSPNVYAAAEKMVDEGTFYPAETSSGRHLVFVPGQTASELLFPRESSVGAALNGVVMIAPRVMKSFGSVFMNSMEEHEGAHIAFDARANYSTQKQESYVSEFYAGLTHMLYEHFESDGVLKAELPDEFSVQPLQDKDLPLESEFKQKLRKEMANHIEQYYSSYGLLSVKDRSQFNKIAAMSIEWLVSKLEQTGKNRGELLAELMETLIRATSFEEGVDQLTAMLTSEQLEKVERALEMDAVRSAFEITSRGGIGRAIARGEALSKMITEALSQSKAAAENIPVVSEPSSKTITFGKVVSGIYAFNKQEFAVPPADFLDPNKMNEFFTNPTFNSALFAKIPTEFQYAIADPSRFNSEFQEQLQRLAKLVNPQRSWLQRIYDFFVSIWTYLMGRREVKVYKQIFQSKSASSGQADDPKNIARSDARNEKQSGWQKYFQFKLWQFFAAVTLFAVGLWGWMLWSDYSYTRDLVQQASTEVRLANGNSGLQTERFFSPYLRGVIADESMKESERINAILMLAETGRTDALEFLEKQYRASKDENLRSWILDGISHSLANPSTKGISDADYERYLGLLSENIKETELVPAYFARAIQGRNTQGEIKALGILKSGLWLSIEDRIETRIETRSGFIVVPWVNAWSAMLRNENIPDSFKNELLTQLIGKYADAQKVLAANPKDREADIRSDELKNHLKIFAKAKFQDAADALGPAARSDVRQTIIRVKVEELPGVLKKLENLSENLRNEGVRESEADITTSYLFGDIGKKAREINHLGLWITRNTGNSGAITGALGVSRFADYKPQTQHVVLRSLTGKVAFAEAAVEPIYQGQKIGTALETGALADLKESRPEGILFYGGEIANSNVIAIKTLLSSAKAQGLTVWGPAPKGGFSLFLVQLTPDLPQDIRNLFEQNRIAALPKDTDKAMEVIEASQNEAGDSQALARADLRASPKGGQKQRRLPQFSLRSLIIFITLIGLGLPASIGIYYQRQMRGTLEENINTFPVMEEAEKSPEKLKALGNIAVNLNESPKTRLDALNTLSFTLQFSDKVSENEKLQILYLLGQALRDPDESAAMQSASALNLAAVDAFKAHTPAIRDRASGILKDEVKKNDPAISNAVFSYIRTSVEEMQKDAPSARSDVRVQRYFDLDVYQFQNMIDKFENDLREKKRQATPARTEFLENIEAEYLRRKPDLLNDPAALLDVASLYVNPSDDQRETLKMVSEVTGISESQMVVVDPVKGAFFLALMGKWDPNSYPEGFHANIQFQDGTTRSLIVMVSTKGQTPFKFLKTLVHEAAHEKQSLTAIQRYKDLFMMAVYEGFQSYEERIIFEKIAGEPELRTRLEKLMNNNIETGIKSYEVGYEVRDFSFDQKMDFLLRKNNFYRDFTVLVDALVKIAGEDVVRKFHQTGTSAPLARAIGIKKFNAIRELAEQNSEIVFYRFWEPFYMNLLARVVSEISANEWSDQHTRRLLDLPAFLNRSGRDNGILGNEDESWQETYLREPDSLLVLTNALLDYVSGKYNADEMVEAINKGFQPARSEARVETEMPAEYRPVVEALIRFSGQRSIEQVEKALWNDLFLAPFPAVQFFLTSWMYEKDEYEWTVGVRDTQRVFIQAGGRLDREFINNIKEYYKAEVIAREMREDVEFIRATVRGLRDDPAGKQYLETGSLEGFSPFQIQETYQTFIKDKWSKLSNLYWKYDTAIQQDTQRISGAGAERRWRWRKNKMPRELTNFLSRFHKSYNLRLAGAQGFFESSIEQAQDRGRQKRAEKYAAEIESLIAKIRRTAAAANKNYFEFAKEIKNNMEIDYASVYKNEHLAHFAEPAADQFWTVYKAENGIDIGNAEQKFLLEALITGLNNEILSRSEVRDDSSGKISKEPDGSKAVNYSRELRWGSTSPAMQLSPGSAITLYIPGTERKPLLGIRLHNENQGIIAIKFLTGASDHSGNPITEDILLEPGQSFKIGRHSANDMIFESLSVSRFHGILTVHQKGWVVYRDAGSLYGSGLNALRLKDVFVTDDSEPAEDNKPADLHSEMSQLSLDMSMISEASIANASQSMIFKYSPENQFSWDQALEELRKVFGDFAELKKNRSKIIESNPEANYLFSYGEVLIEEKLFGNPAQPYYYRRHGSRPNEVAIRASRSALLIVEELKQHLARAEVRSQKTKELKLDLIAAAHDYKVYEIEADEVSQDYGVLESAYEFSPAGGNRFFIISQEDSKGQQEPFVLIRVTENQVTEKRVKIHLAPIYPNSQKEYAANFLHSGLMGIALNRLTSDPEAAAALEESGLDMTERYSTQWESRPSKQNSLKGIHLISFAEQSIVLEARTPARSEVRNKNVRQEEVNTRASPAKMDLNAKIGRLRELLLPALRQDALTEIKNRMASSPAEGIDRLVVFGAEMEKYFSVQAPELVNQPSLDENGFANIQAIRTFLDKRKFLSEANSEAGKTIDFDKSSHLLLDYYYVKILTDLTALAILEARSGAEEGLRDQISALKELLRNIQSGESASGHSFVNDLMALFIVGTSLASENENDYLTLERQADLLTPEDNLRYSALAAASLGRHLRAVLANTGAGKQFRDLFEVRKTNSLDYAMLVVSLSRALRAYRDNQLGDPQIKRLAQAIFSGISADPAVFTNKDLLNQIIFMEGEYRVPGAPLPYDESNKVYVKQHIEDYFSLLSEAKSGLLQDARGLTSPARETYHPFGLMATFAANVFDLMVWNRILDPNKGDPFENHLWGDNPSFSLPEFDYSFERASQSFNDTLTALSAYAAPLAGLELSLSGGSNGKEQIGQWINASVDQSSGASRLQTFWLELGEESILDILTRYAAFSNMKTAEDIKGLLEQRRIDGRPAIELWAEINKRFKQFYLTQLGAWIDQGADRDTKIERAAEVLREIILFAQMSAALIAINSELSLDQNIGGNHETLRKLDVLIKKAASDKNSVWLQTVPSLGEVMLAIESPYVEEAMTGQLLELSEATAKWPSDLYEQVVPIEFLALVNHLEQVAVLRQDDAESAGVVRLLPILEGNRMDLQEVLQKFPKIVEMAEGGNLLAKQAVMKLMLFAPEFFFLPYETEFYLGEQFNLAVNESSSPGYRAVIEAAAGFLSAAAASNDNRIGINFHEAFTYTLTVNLAQAIHEDPAASIPALSDVFMGNAKNQAWQQTASAQNRWITETGISLQRNFPERYGAVNAKVSRHRESIFNYIKVLNGRSIQNEVAQGINSAKLQLWNDWGEKFFSLNLLAASNARVQGTSLAAVFDLMKGPDEVIKIIGAMVPARIKQIVQAFARNSPENQSEFKAMTIAFSVYAGILKQLGVENYSSIKTRKGFAQEISAVVNAVIDFKKEGIEAQALYAELSKLVQKDNPNQDIAALVNSHRKARSELRDLGGAPTGESERPSELADYRVDGVVDYLADYYQGREKLSFDEINNMAFRPPLNLFPRDKKGVYYPLSRAEIAEILEKSLIRLSEKTGIDPDLEEIKQQELDMLRNHFIAGQFNKGLPFNLNSLHWLAVYAALLEKELKAKYPGYRPVALARDGLMWPIASFQEKADSVYWPGQFTARRGTQGFKEVTDSISKLTDAMLVELEKQFKDLELKEKKIAIERAFVERFLALKNDPKEGSQIQLFLDWMSAQFNHLGLKADQPMVIYDTFASGKSALSVLAAFKNFYPDTPAEVLIMVSKGGLPGLNDEYGVHGGWPAEFAWPFSFARMNEDKLPEFDVQGPMYMIQGVGLSLAAYNRYARSEDIKEAVDSALSEKKIANWEGFKGFIENEISPIVFPEVVQQESRADVRPRSEIRTEAQAKPQLSDDQLNRISERIVTYFISRFGQEYGQEAQEIADEVIELVRANRWNELEANVRAELDALNKSAGISLMDEAMQGFNKILIDGFMGKSDKPYNFGIILDLAGQEKEVEDLLSGENGPSVKRLISLAYVSKQMKDFKTHGLNIERRGNLLSLGKKPNFLLDNPVKPHLLKGGEAGVEKYSVPAQLGKSEDAERETFFAPLLFMILASAVIFSSDLVKQSADLNDPVTLKKVKDEVRARLFFKGMPAAVQLTEDQLEQLLQYDQERGLLIDQSILLTLVMQYQAAQQAAKAA